MATEAETTVNMLDSLDCDVALDPEEWLRRVELHSRNNNLAQQPFAFSESLLGDAIESFAAQIFGDAFDRQFARLPQQTHWPMHCNPLALAAITR